MSHIRCAARLFLCVLFIAGCSPARDRSKVRVQFIVTAPELVPAGDEIFVSGDLRELGGWNGRGVALRRAGGGEYRGTVELPRGQKAEFKFTGGSWETVEKGGDDEEIANRTIDLDQDQVVRATVAKWRMPGAARKPTITGEVRYHRNFRSKILDNQRTLIVWLPPGYGQDSSARYPVLYMHDGQNVFDDATSFAGEWRADETATRLIEEGKIKPIIIVGVENTPDRAEEYTPTEQIRRSATTKSLLDPEDFEGGNGENYARFLIAEVKPFIDQTYRTLPDRANTAVAGSSLGGLMSLYLGYKHGDVFGMCGVISPSLWWDRRAMLLKLETENAWMRREKLWVDMGSAEGSGVDPQENIRNARELHAIMLRAGLKENRDFIYKEFEGAAHNETAWAARFDQVLLFFFGTRS